MTAGVDGLLRDKTRPSRIPRLASDVVDAGGGADHDRRRRARPRTGPRAPWPRRSASRPLGAADLARARAAAAPGQGLQALQRPALRREAARHRRAVRRPAGACHRALGRREVADPGARPDPARAADEEGPAGDHDPRLQAQRHHHPVRRAQRARRLGDRPVHAAPPPPGIHPLPQPDRARRARPAS